MRNVSRLLFWTLFFVFTLFLFLNFSKKIDRTIELNAYEHFLDTKLHNDEYCIGYNFLKSSGTFREDGLEPVTLTTHGNFEMIKIIENKPSNWDGPISIGLFIDFHSKKALEYIADVHRCYKEFREKVTVHFAFRISPFQRKCPSIEMPASTRPCYEFRKNQKKYREAVDGPFQLYPYNLMRNIARIGAQSDIHLVADADLIMSEGTARKIKPIANRMIDGKNKKLLVLRKFETEEKTLPRNFTQLEAGFKNKKVFEFHHKFFFVGHRIPNITEWFDRSSKSDDVIAWKIPYINVNWEVQVILHRNDLYNADYFPSRIRDVTSLIYKSCRANYTFNLLSNVFSVHEGIKLDDTMYSKVVTAHSRKYGRIRAYDRYVKELNEAYPDTLKKCGKFIMW